MSPKKETLILFLTFLITIFLLGLGIWGYQLWTKRNVGSPVSLEENPPEIESNQNGTDIKKRLSFGDKILITADRTPEKETGIQALAGGNLEGAIAQLEASLKKSRNDPEALIYLNNARALETKNYLTIGLSVPIGGNLNVAQEIIRGVAHAQEEINRQGGIKGKLLQVVIANDDNNPEIAAKVAQEFIENREILAVVGHNSSTASLGAAPVYNEGKLVAVSPTSTASKLSGISDYLFRSVPSSGFSAAILSDRIIDDANINTLAICWDSQDAASLSVKNEISNSFLAKGGQISKIVCDFSDENFNASDIPSQVIADGAEGLLIAPAVNQMNEGVDLAKATDKRLKLFGTDTFYTATILKQGKGAVEGLVLTVPWHYDAITNHPFNQDAMELWGGRVNWRTALAYDAATAIIQALKKAETREGIQTELSRSDFSFDGATGKVEFLPGSGDRNGSVHLVMIRATNNSTSETGYDFVPLNSLN